MSTFSFNSPAYKTLRCRHFDQRGRSIKSGCTQGDRCRFIHPSDPHWNRVKMAASPTTAGGTGNGNVSGTRTPIRSGGRQSARLRSPRMSVGAKHHVSTHRSRGEPVPEDRSDGPARSHRDSPVSRPYDARSYLGVSKPEYRPDHYRFPKGKKQTRHLVSQSQGVAFQSKKSDLRFPPATVDAKKSHLVRAGDDVPLKSASVQVKPLTGEGAPSEADNFAVGSDLSQGNESATKLMDIFRRLAKCSNKVAQDTAAQDREETKLQTYNQISSTLASITTTAASAVTPTLTNIIRNHMQSQLQVEASLKALEELWEEVFDVFVTEIARVIDDKLQDALQKVHAACDRTKTAVSPSSRKRKTVGVASRSISDSADDLGATRRLGILSRKSEEVAFQRELKRRRTESPFHDGSVQPSDKGGDINTQTNVKDVAQLPAKINQQAHSLDKENIFKTSLPNQHQSTPFVVLQSSPSSQGFT